MTGDKWLVIVHRHENPPNEDAYGVHVITKRDPVESGTDMSDTSPLGRRKQLMYSYNNRAVGLYSGRSWSMIKDFMNKLLLKPGQTNDKQPLPTLPVGDLYKYIATFVIPIEWKSQDEEWVRNRIKVYPVK